MKDTLNCNIVRDMLPLYAEKLTSEESNTVIRQHLEQCEDCRTYLEHIQKPIDFPTVPKIEIEYMRKVKYSLKRRTYILSGVIAASCIILLGIFLRLFIVGSPVFMGDSPINYQWNYDTGREIYSIRGTLEQTKNSVRVKVYDDKQSNQINIKMYEIMPSVFFPSNHFSLDIPWNGDTNIVWQGKSNQQVIMGSQYLNLFISKFQDGNYEKLIDVFDMDGAAMIKRLYDNAPDISSNALVPFDETKYNQYMIISLPLTSGKYSAVWIADDNALQEQALDERIFLYEEDGQYYFYKQGQHLKSLSSKDIDEILNYIKTKEVSQ